MNIVLTHVALILKFAKLRQNKDKHWKSAALAQWANQPRRLYEQHLQRMRNLNLIKSIRGPKGGYTITEAGREATLLTLVTLFGSDTDKALLPLMRERYGEIKAEQVADAIERYEVEKARLLKMVEEAAA